MERLALARLKSHIATSPYFCAMQSAYRAAHSIETALVKIVDGILQSVDTGSIAALIGLDISATFDTMNHATLLARLQSEVGIIDTPPTWIKGSFLDLSCSQHM